MAVTFSWDQWVNQDSISTYLKIVICKVEQMREVFTYVMLFLIGFSCCLAWSDTGLILGLRPANERRCYFVMASLIGWAQA